MLRRSFLMAGLLLMARPALAQWAVIDVANVAQTTATAFNSAMTAVNTAASYIRQGEQIINEYNLILNQIKQYETMVKNLTRLPQGLNFFDTISAYGTQLTSLLGQANTLGYTLDSATRQFDALYEDVRTTATGDFRAIEQRFLAARMQASSVAVQVQSIRETSITLFDRLCKLLDGSWKAEGNLDSLQIAAQKQALQLAAEQQTQAIQATAFRLQAQREAEDVARTRLKLHVLDTFTSSLPDYDEAVGALPRWAW